MKKNILFLLAVMALGIVSCNRNKVSNTDLVIVDHGNMSFYNLETQRLIPYEKETDSVINLLFDEDGHLYYTVTKNDNLLLKMVDMNQASPAPKECAYWNMKLENALDEMSGEVSSIFWDMSGENIIIYKTDYEDYTLSALLYNVQTGKVSEKSYDEVFNLRDFEKDFDPSHFYTKDKQFYYVKPEGEVCLTDKIDFRQVFEDEVELEDLYFDPETFSPDGQTLVYSATVFWGEGWGYYGMANIDGSSQCLLKDSDVWDFTPSWLADGSLVYVGNTARPKDDPEYDEDWNNTQPCINLIGRDKSTKTLSLGKTFAVRPFGEKKAVAEKQGNLEGCDVAILDNGQVTFYNSTTGEFVPFVVETDSVINGVFVYGDAFYYTVSIGNKLYLKEIYMSEYVTYPSMRANWELNLDECISETYGKASTLAWIPAFDRIGISHNFSWDYYNFADIKFFAYFDNKMFDGWSEDEDVETDIFDEEFMKYQNDIEHFIADEGQYFYSSEDGVETCLTDQLNFEEMASDPSYFEEPEFCFYSIDPTRTKVAYSAIIEWGDLGHGPLCMSSLDGKMQMAFKGTDASDLTWGWLPDGSLLYVGEEARSTDDPDYNAEWNSTKPCIKIVYTDGREEVFSHATDFVVSMKL